MAYSPMLVINASGIAYPVYDLQTNERKGTINNREAFISIGGEGDFESIKFLSPSGTLLTVAINDYRNPPPEGWGIECEKYPYGEDYIDGDHYDTYIMQRTEAVYYGNGVRWGTVAKGMCVATNNSDTGHDHVDWKEIDYVERTDHQWIRVSGNGYEHGFVDTGLSQGSNPSSIAFYGSW